MRRHNAAASVIFQRRDTSESRLCTQIPGSPLIKGNDSRSGQINTWETPLLPKYVPLTSLIPVLKMAKVTFSRLVHLTLEAATAISLLQRANLVHYLIFISIL